ncbi:glycosyltransferase family 4 protein [Patulibacter sp.]|uniref:glycosyltransferase family 4 protein n=1 Tax=Patulibacter sp. TaxID=1912859 RepID=UPI00272499A8|nr:glycosyltransferase family 4 protein [Patulibacter sp.]MDO9410768.1 glycosyltransferase family 4 protein [Patulibacter sp.]
MTPDFAPRVGGISTLCAGVVKHQNRVQMDVLTFHGDRAGDAMYPGTIRRLPPLLGPASGQVMALNAACVGLAVKARYDLVIAGHVVVAPGAAASRRPWVLYAHAKELLYREWLAKFFLPRASAVIAVSRYTEQLVIERGALPFRVHRIPPGVDVTEPAGSGGRTDPNMILTVCRLDDEHKGIDFLIRALPAVRARVTDAHLVIVGRGRLRSMLEAVAEQLGVSDVVSFAGGVDDDQRDELLETAAVFAMPNRIPPGEGGEGFGIVFLEAASRGVPTLAGSVGGARDAVEHGVSGLLVDSSSVEEVANGLIRILQTDRDVWREGARAWAEHFAWPRVSAEIEQVLTTAANEHPPLPVGRSERRASPRS